MPYELLFRWPSGERTIKLDGPIVVGRDPSCDLPVDSVRLSRRHAEFIPTARGISVRDLGSRNGILVNGKRVDEALVGPADRVLLGDVAVMVGGGQAAEAARHSSPASPASPASPVAATPGPTTSPVLPAPPPSPIGAMDKTTILPRAGLPSPAAAPAATTDAAVRTKRLRLGLGARLFGAALVVALGTFAATACPVVKARNDAIRSAAIARATTIVRALGVANGLALAAGQTAAVGVNEAAAEPGVRELLLLAPDGRVIAPANLVGNRVTTLPALGEIGDLQGVQSVEIGAEIHAAAVIEAGGRRIGVAWVRLDPTYAAASAPVGLYLTAALFVGLALAALTAFWTRKLVRARVSSFATDVDLAASGQLSTVTEGFGVPQLAESVNFVIGRLRQVPAPVRVAAPPPAPSSSPSVGAREGYLVLDSTFVVQEVDPGAAELLRTTPAQLLGQHVLAAIPEPSLVTALIDTIADTATVGKSPRHVVKTSGMATLALEAERVSPDGPVRVTIQQVGS